jgi:hypothetical protein
MAILLAEDYLGPGAGPGLQIGSENIPQIASLPGGKELNLVNIVNALVTFLIPLGAMILFVFLLWGGFDFLMANGEPEKMKSGKAKITSGIIGFVLLVFAYVITKILASIFGIGSSMF